MGFVLWYMYPNKYESMTYSLSSTGNNDVLQLKRKGNSLVNMQFSFKWSIAHYRDSQANKSWLGYKFNFDLDISSILSLE